VTLPTEPGPRLLGRPAVKARLALGSALVLIAGALLAPAAPPGGVPVSAPQEHAAPLLGAQVQTRAAELPFRGVQEVAVRVRDHAIAIATPAISVRTATDYAPPAPDSELRGFGVYVSSSHVLTHAAALDGRTSLRLGGGGAGTVDATVAAFDPPTGLTLLATPPVGRPAAIAATIPDPGSLAVAVGRVGARHIAVPSFVVSAGVDRYRLAGAGGALQPGMPVYTMDGELFGIAGATDALAVRETLSRLLERASSGTQMSSLGVGYQELTGALATVFGDRGVLIDDVVEGGPAARGGIRPGDVLLAIGEGATADPEAAARASAGLRPGVPVILKIVRSRKELDVTATPATAYEVSSLAHARDAPDRGAPEAGALFPAPVLEAAGIPAAARVLLLAGRPPGTRVEADRLLGRSRAPVPVLIRVGDRQFFAAIEPAR
jgi:S1-C subfamily serine protease